MNNPKPSDPTSETPTNPKSSGSRRAFLRNVRGAAIAAATVSAVGIEPLLGGKESLANAQQSAPSGPRRANESLELRTKIAVQERAVPVPNHPTNGDLQRYPDQANTYTKCLPHDAFGRVDLKLLRHINQRAKLRRIARLRKNHHGRRAHAQRPARRLRLRSRRHRRISIRRPASSSRPRSSQRSQCRRTSRTLLGPLLRDVPFIQYDSNPIANAAAAELSALSVYQGPRNAANQVTPDRSSAASSPVKRSVPTCPSFTSHAHCARRATDQPASDHVSPQHRFHDRLRQLAIRSKWRSAGQANTPAIPQPRYLHDGRGLASWTHVDVLYQAYFTAFLVLSSLNTPFNPGNPYIGSKTENGFGTFGSPDVAATMAEVATRALKAVWFQKWQVHLRARPEANAGLVYLIKTGQAAQTDAKFSNVILNSQGLQAKFQQIRHLSALSAKPSPKARPHIPLLPTGHGTVGGACITVLKFFFDGSYVIPNPVTPSDDGLTLNPYTGADAGQLTVNGELNKLGHNASFGHGVHAGIHWRSDTDVSLRLGEAVALSVLRDRAQTYNENFTVHLTKFDGTTTKISNQ